MRNLLLFWVVALLVVGSGCRENSGEDKELDTSRPVLCVYDEMTISVDFRTSWIQRCSELPCMFVESDYSCQSVYGIIVCAGDEIDYRVELYGTCDEFRSGVELDRTDWRDEVAGWSLTYYGNTNDNMWYYELTGERTPHAENCQSFLDCYVPCDPDGPDGDECWECYDEIRYETLGLVAAFDAGVCAWQECSTVCVPGAGEECFGCMEERCPEPMAACASGDPDYEDRGGETIYSCAVLWSFIGKCLEQNPGDEECFFEYYWEGTPEARVDYMKLLATFNEDGRCAQECSSPGASCDECISYWVSYMNIEDCY